MTTMDHIALDEQARAILKANDRGGYTIPTSGLYPYQWNWDSIFCAWGYLTFDPDRAWREVETLFDGQWPNGMVPHILFREPDPGYFPGPEVWGANHGPVPSSGITQPPVAATFLRAISEKAPDDDRLRPLFRRLKDWHRWFLDWRSDGQGIFVTHPWEAGRDNAPDWDASMARLDPVGVGDYTRRDIGHVDPSMRPTKDEYDRYVWLVQRGNHFSWDEAAMAEERPLRVTDPAMTFILLRANRDLAELAAYLGEEKEEIDSWTKRLVAEAESLWNEEKEIFDAVDLNTGVHTGHLSNASFLCWYAGIDNAAMLAKFDRTLSSCDYPVPSHSVWADGFDARRYWRGPTWAIMNAMIGVGLSDMGHHERSEALRRATRQMISSNGFAEYFDPIAGTPAGGGLFSWTAAVWLAWASPSAEKT